MNQQHTKTAARKSVLVTGASTGFGWATSLAVADAGCRVFSAARQASVPQKLVER